ncbi:hypothetical protein BDZ89DRAFT_1053887 [Hymenopellis radicata]|nr:hypothetical protein BDZ89DRAFT_1053887 [Hymenopellis radicata]
MRRASVVLPQPTWEPMPQVLLPDDIKNYVDKKQVPSRTMAPTLLNSLYTLWCVREDIERQVLDWLTRVLHLPPAAVNTAHLGTAAQMFYALHVEQFQLEAEKIMLWHQSQIMQGYSPQPIIFYSCHQAEKMLPLASKSSQNDHEGHQESGDTFEGEREADDDDDDMSDLTDLSDSEDEDEDDDIISVDMDIDHDSNMQPEYVTSQSRLEVAVQRWIVCWTRSFPWLTDNKVTRYSLAELKDLVQEVFNRKQIKRRPSKTRLQLLRTLIADILSDMDIIGKEAMEENAEEWIKLIKSSQLAGLLLRLSEMAEVAIKGDDSSRHLFPLLRLDTAVMKLLDDWIPAAVLASLPREGPKFIPTPSAYMSSNATLLRNDDAEKFLQLFEQHPELIPRIEEPSSIGFLLNYDNFLRCYEDWLGPALQLCNICLEAVTPKILFDNLWRLLNKATRHHKRPFDSPNPTLALLINRTIDLKRSPKRLKEKLFKYQPKLHTDKPTAAVGCTACEHTDKRCSELVWVSHKELSHLAGCGMSLHERAHVMLPQASKDSACPTRVVHPAELSLKPIKPDEEIIQRCGHHIILLVAKPDEMRVKGAVHRIWDRRLTSSSIMRMIRRLYPEFKVITTISSVEIHVVLLLPALKLFAAMKPLSRGQQFRFWSGGTMICFGARQPSGGGPGDNYTTYAGMDCYTMNGMNASFDMILFAEYAFCQPEWGYYIITRANTIWSFSSADLHGTMLPSRHPWTTSSTSNNPAGLGSAATSVTQNSPVGALAVHERPQQGKGGGGGGGVVAEALTYPSPPLQTMLTVGFENRNGKETAEWVSQLRQGRRQRDTRSVPRQACGAALVRAEMANEEASTSTNILLETSTVLDRYRFVLSQSNRVRLDRTLRKKPGQLSG